MKEQKYLKGEKKYHNNSKRLINNLVLGPTTSFMNKVESYMKNL